MSRPERTTEGFFDDSCPMPLWPVPQKQPPHGGTACRHGREECSRCGTTDRRDVRHRSAGGRGVVGQLLRCGR